MPISGDCVITTKTTLLGGRASTGKLIVDVPKPLFWNPDLQIGGDSADPSLREGSYTFAGGTEVRSGYLEIMPRNTLVSDVTVAAASGDRAARLAMFGKVIGWLANAGRVTIAGEWEGNVANAGELHAGGTVRGNVDNGGKLWLSGLVTGNVTNRGALEYSGATYEGPPPRIAGSLALNEEGTLRVALTPGDWSGYPTVALQVTGQARLAGHLELLQYTDAWGPYALPALGAHHLLHADGGLSGAFASWSFPGVFVTGGLRYEPNDVWFDLTRISATAAMAASAQATPLTLASAANLDSALGIADGFAQAPTMAQQGFLSTAGKLLWMQDTVQAVRALDTLSGRPQAQAAQAAFYAATPLALAAQLDARVPGQAAGAWAQSNAGGRVSGTDAWLGPRMLAGVHASQAGAAAHATLDASAAHRDSGTGAYLRWFGDGGWHAGVQAGYAKRNVSLQRPIDFGAAGRWHARSQRSFDVATASGEAGRRFLLGHASLTPFLQLDASALHADAAVEQGSSGFELRLAPTSQQRLQAGAGVRYARDWHVAGHGLQLRAAGGVAQPLAVRGAPLRAAFTGVPDAWFELPGASGDMRGWFDLGLTGEAGERWSWAIHGARTPHAGSAWRLQIGRGL